MYSKSIIVRNHAGLHNRQATLFVQKANEFESFIYLERGSQRINAKSLLGVMCLCVQTGESITITADGPDAQAAVSALELFLLADMY
ncbi:MAG: HPr family phosphocarrier protein [Oscillospiraceae bacterium]|nr:HPr family phosphocarrier protein [Oscillospiraceae bacterium]